MDIETTDLYPAGKIITLGLVDSNGILHVYQLWNPDKYDSFKQICINLLKQQPKPFYAYSPEFEQSFLGFKGSWKDLLEWETVECDWNEWGYHTYRLTCHSAACRKGLHLPEDITGRYVPIAWRKYLQHENLNMLSEIAWHNYCDVTRVAWLACFQ